MSLLGTTSTAICVRSLLLAYLGELKINKLKKKRTYELDTYYKMKHINIVIKVNSSVKITLKKNNTFYLKFKNKLTFILKNFLFRNNNLKSLYAFNRTI